MVQTSFWTSTVTLKSNAGKWHDNGPAIEADLTLSAVLIGGSIAGALDITICADDAAVNGMVPQRLLQLVASGLLGRGRLTRAAGLSAAARAGCPLRHVIPVGGHFRSHGASRVPGLASRGRFSAGAIFGVIVFLSMRLVDAAAFPRFHTRSAFKSLSAGLDLLSHMFLFGVPIALAAATAIRREANETSHGYRRNLLQGQGSRALRAWYKKHLGIDVQDWGGAAFRWTDDAGNPTTGHDDLVDRRGERRLLRAEQGSFMINYRVADLAALARGAARRGLQRARKDRRLRVRQVRLGDGPGRQQGRALAAAARLMTRLAGSCLCGAIRFSVEDAFRYALNCHCSQCRRSTGSAFKPFAGIERTKFEVEAGADGLLLFGDSDCHDAHCGTCGSFMYSVVQDGQIVHVNLGALRDPPSIRPTAHIYVGSKAPWYEISDDLPQHDELPL